MKTGPAASRAGPVTRSSPCPDTGATPIPVSGLKGATVTLHDPFAAGHRLGRTTSTHLRTTLVALVVGVLVALGGIPPVAAGTRIPKVVLIVGPVGGITANYKALANEAARVARAAGAQVVKVYSPNATWPAVKAAITDASIVVYLGHGNGWPSRYRDALYPPSQNGFGLNPVAGADDSSHQYFGEASVDNVRLADNAVVLLNHLCYASGNTEPVSPRAASTSRPSAWTTTPPGSSAPARRPSSPRRTWDPPGTSASCSRRTRSITSDLEPLARARTATR